MTPAEWVENHPEVVERVARIIQESHGGFGFDRLVAHRALIAADIPSLLADAWEDGYNQADDNHLLDPKDVVIVNPYRKAT